jgi:hypothetical protein
MGMEVGHRTRVGYGFRIQVAYLKTANNILLGSD